MWSRQLRDCRAPCLCVEGALKVCRLLSWAMAAAGKLPQEQRGLAGAERDAVVALRCSEFAEELAALVRTALSYVGSVVPCRTLARQSRHTPHTPRTLVHTRTRTHLAMNRRLTTAASKMEVGPGWPVPLGLGAAP